MYGAQAYSIYAWHIMPYTIYYIVYNTTYPKIEYVRSILTLTCGMNLNMNIYDGRTKFRFR